jgi:drug/metabolite transporter (DMT)-like permease
MHYAGAATHRPCPALNSRQLLQLFVLASIWGASFMFIRLTVPYFGPVPLSAARSLIAALVLTPLLLMKGQWPAFRQSWKHLLVIGLISTALPFSFLSISTQYTSAGFASILNALTPIFSALVAWLWLKESLTPAVIIGILLGFAGVFVMVFDRETISASLPLLPVLAGVGGTLLYGLTGNYSRRYMVGVPVLTIAAGSQIFSSLLLLPLAVMQWPDAPIPTVSWVYTCILGVVCTGLAYILYFGLLATVGVARTVIVTYLVPVFAMLWGYAILDESATLQMLAGAACILCGIGLTTYRPKPAPATGTNAS